MKQTIMAVALTVTTLLLGSSPSFSQSPADGGLVAASSAPVTRVYAPTPNGIYAYNASEAGKLTLIPGSPFRQTTGLAIGSTGRYFITLGTYWVHAYAIKLDGGIGKQVSSVNTLNHGGSNCEYTPDGTPVGTHGAVLDHQGKNVYAFMYATDGSGEGCAAYQTYNIASSGDLIFNASTQWYTPSPQEAAGGLTFAGNDKFGYAFLWDWGDSETPYYWLYGYSRESQGKLERIRLTETDPRPEPGYSYSACSSNCSIAVDSLAADGTNHLAVAITSQLISDPYGGKGSTQLASYTVDEDGNLSSTNTWKNMPTVVQVCPCSVCGYQSCSRNQMAISPAGNLLAVATGMGVQVFHFNGSKPITKYTGIIGKFGPVSVLGWDRSNHLYALNELTGKLHIYEVTPTREIEVAGSPITLPAAAKDLFIVSK